MWVTAPFATEAADGFGSKKKKRLLENMLRFSFHRKRTFQKVHWQNNQHQIARVRRYHLLKVLCATARLRCHKDGWHSISNQTWAHRRCHTQCVSCATEACVGCAQVLLTARLCHGTWAAATLRCARKRWIPIGEMTAPRGVSRNVTDI